MLPADSVNFPPDCESVVRALWDHLDGETDPETTRSIDEHLASCEGCRSHADFERDVVERISALRREHSNPDRLKSEVLAALQDAGLGG
jgi:anti-sigma factor (TIGR02949 family)